MPQAIPILIGLAISIALSLIQGIVSKIFAPKQQKGPVLGFEDRTDSQLAASAPQEFVFGEVRKGGTIIYQRNSTNRQNLWMVIALAGHQSDSVPILWLGNEQMSIGTGGSVSLAKYAANVFCYVHLGADDQTVDTNLQAAFPDDWTESHRLRGITYIVLEFIFSSSLFAQGIPNPSAFMRGYNQIEDIRTGVTGFSFNPLLCARSYLMNTVFGLSTTVDEIDDDSVLFGANTCDEQPVIPSWDENFTCAGGETATNILVNSLPSDLLQGDNLDWPVIADFQAAFPNGTAVTFTTTGTLPAPLVVGTTYYIRLQGGANRQFQLHPTAADALANTNRIDITTSPAGVHTMTSPILFLQMLGAQTTFTADTGTDKITLTDYLNLNSGGEQTIVVFTSTTTLPAPLDNVTRYGIELSLGLLTSTVWMPDMVTPINLTSTGAGTHTLTIHGTRYLFNGFFVDPVLDTLVLSLSNQLHPRYAGRALSLTVTLGSQLPQGLVDGETYYMIPYDDTHIRIATTRENAMVGKYVDLTDTGAGALVRWTMETIDTNQDEITNLITGTRIQLTVPSGFGNLPTPLAINTDYYAISLGRERFELAETYADSVAGIAIVITDVGTDANQTYKITVMSEPRYACSGSWDASQEYGEVLKGILSACAGRFVPPGDVWHLYPGVWSPPLTTLTLDSIRPGGVPKLQTRLTRRDAANTVTGKFISSLNFDLPADFPAQSFASMVEEDGGDILVRDLVYPFTPSKWMAIRLALIELFRARYQRTLEWPADLALFELTVTDVVMAAITGVDLANVYFEIVNLEIGVETSSDNQGPIPTMDLVLREVSQQIFDDTVVIYGLS